ncbi:MAG TPA: hypothetical protein VIQ30_05690 [Pseudonocardia sp.]
MNQHPTPHAWDADDNKPVIPKIPHQRPAPASDLDVAIRVAQQLLDSDQVPALREALRILLRALDAEPVTEEEAARRFVDRHFPEVADFLASERGGQ